MSRTVKALIGMALYVCLFSSRAFPVDVSIMSSSDIIPYNTCIEGIKESLDGYDLQTVNIAENVEEGRDALSDIVKKKPKLVIAVGPQAAFVLSSQQSFLRLFCMILNPVKLLGQEGLFPGVSLNIPPHFQIQKIKETFPERKRVGVFFNKTLNRATVDILADEAKKRDMAIVGFPVESAQEIPAILSSKEYVLDVLLVIPDDQLGSTKIVEYLIKESLRKKIPVVGYNSWFAKNGAVLSFIVDYKNVGAQTAALAKKLLNGSMLDRGGIMYPEKIKISLDVKTAEKIGVKLSPAVIQQADEVIR